MRALRVISCREAIALCGSDLDTPKATRATFSRHLPITRLSKDGLYVFQVNISREYEYGGDETSARVAVWQTFPRECDQYRFCIRTTIGRASITRRASKRDDMIGFLLSITGFDLVISYRLSQVLIIRIPSNFDVILSTPHPPSPKIS